MVPGSYATEKEIRASAMLLGTTILIYAHGQTYDWELHHKSGDFRSDIDKNEKCIYLEALNETHFQVVMAVEEYPEVISK